MEADYVNPAATDVFPAMIYPETGLARSENVLLCLAPPRQNNITVGPNGTPSILGTAGGPDISRGGIWESSFARRGHNGGNGSDRLESIRGLMSRVETDFVSKMCFEQGSSSGCSLHRH